MPPASNRLPSGSFENRDDERMSTPTDSLSTTMVATHDQPNATAATRRLNASPSQLSRLSQRLPRLLRTILRHTISVAAYSMTRTTTATVGEAIMTRTDMVGLSRQIARLKPAPKLRTMANIIHLAVVMSRIFCNIAFPYTLYSNQVTSGDVMG